MPLSQLKESEAVPWRTAEWVKLSGVFLGGPLVEKLGTNHNLCCCPRGYIWIVLTMLA